MTSPPAFVAVRNGDSCFSLDRSCVSCFRHPTESFTKFIRVFNNQSLAFFTFFKNMYFFIDVYVPVSSVNALEGCADHMEA